MEISGFTAGENELAKLLSVAAQQLLIDGFLSPIIRIVEGHYLPNLGS